MLRYLVFFLGVMILAKSQELCGFDTDHIQGLVDRGQQFRNKYNYGIINRNENDHKISQAFVKSCNITDCYIMFSVANSTFIDMIYGNYKLGEDQFYNGKYSRGRGNWDNGQLEECRFEVTAENEFDCRYRDFKLFFGPVIDIKLPINNLNDNIENLVSLAGQHSEKQEYLGDLFEAHRNAFDFLKKLSKEDSINFKSDFYVKEDKESKWHWNKVHVYGFQLFDNDREKVYVVTHEDGGQTGTYVCDMRQNQEFNITSGVVVLSGDVYDEFKWR